jgi:hypothetical protein
MGVRDPGAVEVQGLLSGVGGSKLDEAVAGVAAH